MSLPSPHQQTDQHPASPTPPTQRKAISQPPLPSAPPPPPPRKKFSLFPTISKHPPSPASLVTLATSRNHQPPSEEHVHQIILHLRQGGNTADRATPVGAILRRLRARLVHPQWHICLKALVLAHAILRNGPPTFVEFLANHPKDTFDTRTLREFDKGFAGHVSFVRLYGRYLKAWCAMRREAHFPPSRMTDPDATPHLAKADAQTLLRSIPHIFALLAILPAFVITQEMQTSPIVRPAIQMILHDYVIIHAALSRAMSRLEHVFFHQDMSTAVPLLSLYDAFPKLLAETHPTLTAMLVVDPRMRLPAQHLSHGLRQEMQVFVDDGCQYTTAPGMTPWTAAAIAATQPTLAPASQKDVDTLVRITRSSDPREPTSPFGAVINILFERLQENDPKAVLKAQTLLLILILRQDSSSDALVNHLVMNVRHPCFGAVTEGSENDVHAPLVRWLGAYLATRMSMMQALRSTGSVEVRSARATATAERLMLSLPAIMDVADMLQELPVDLSTRASPAGRRAYFTIVGDVSTVFKEMVRGANELVGVFFELRGEVGRASLSVYERFVAVRERAEAASGMFERAKIVDTGWRRPEEVVGGVEILTHMRIFVDTSCADDARERDVVEGLAGSVQGGNIGKEIGDEGGGMGGEDGGEDALSILRLDDEVEVNVPMGLPQPKMEQKESAGQTVLV